MNIDSYFMGRAIELAKLGYFSTTPNPNVGCVIVRNNQITGEGYHQYSGQDHAEVMALRMAGDAAEGSTAYVTLEPCCNHGKTPPCTTALINAKIARVVIAMQDPNPLVSGKGIKLLQQQGIKVTVGVLTEAAAALNPGFLKRMKTGLPYVILKMAISLDGRTALASKESKWLTSQTARNDVQSLRAKSCAILTTSATVLADNPKLTVRPESVTHGLCLSYPKQRIRQPIRIILDRHNQINEQHEILKQAGECWLIRFSGKQYHCPTNAKILTLPPHNRNSDFFNLPLLLKELARKQLNQILVEAGPILAGSLIRLKLIDELILYIAPKILGHDARALCYLFGINNLKEAPMFKLIKVKQLDNDLRLNLKLISES